MNFRKPFRLGELRKVCSFTTVSNDAPVVLHYDGRELVINDWEYETRQDGSFVLHLEVEDRSQEEEE